MFYVVFSKVSLSTFVSIQNGFEWLCFTNSNQSGQSRRATPGLDCTQKRHCQHFKQHSQANKKKQVPSRKKLTFSTAWKAAAMLLRTRVSDSATLMILNCIQNS